MADNFANHPRSLAEVRSEKTQNAADWSPRDALIDLLRDIDSGARSPDGLVICWRESNSQGGVSSHYTASAKDPLDSVGIVARALHRINKCMDRD